MLPQWPDLYVGRELEMSRVQRLFDEGARVVTLLGPGGVGKTRLACEIARDRGRVVFVDLTPAHSADDVVAVIASALGIGQTDELATRIVERLTERPPDLILLDNVEHVVAHASVIDDWPVPVLATSREELRRGEVVSVEALSVPRAIELLRDRVPRYGTQPDDAVARAIVERVECLPLAIELAAARLDLMRPETLLERLSARFDVLGGGRGRHATLWTTLDWSWSLLEPEERGTLAQCAVFVDGFELGAAEAVVVGPSSVLDALQGLVRKSLVHRRGDRFLLLESVREFATAHLDPHPVRQRHAIYFAHVDDPARDEHNLYAAVDHVDDDMLFVRLLHKLQRLAVRGRGYSWYVKQLARIDVLEVVSAEMAELLLFRGASFRFAQDFETAEGHYERALAMARNVGDTRLEGMSLGYLGDLASLRQDYPAVAERYGAILTIARRTENRRLEGMALNALATDHDARIGDYVGAERAKRAALAIFEEIGDRSLVAQANTTLGEILMRMGRWDEAELVVRNAIEHYRAVPYDRFLVTTIARFGRLRQVQGDLDGAEDAYREAIAIADRILDDYIAGFNLAMMALLEADRGGDPAPWRDRAHARLGDDARCDDARSVADYAVDRTPMRTDTPFLAAVRTRIEAEDAAAFTVAPDGSWFSGPSGERVDLSKRPVLVRVLMRLIAGPATLEDLTAAGWPGETLVAKSARNRVYVALSTLRKGGLPIDRTDAGYALAVPVREA